MLAVESIRRAVHVGTFEPALLSALCNLNEKVETKAPSRQSRLNRHFNVSSVSINLSNQQRTNLLFDLKSHFANWLAGKKLT